MSRLKGRWLDDYRVWRQREIEGELVYIWADGIYVKAGLDRLVHHAHLVPIVGESFRMKDHKTRQKGEGAAKK